MPKKDKSSSAIILAASRGSAFGDITKETPKCMLEVCGQPLLRRLVDIFRDGGVRDVTVVRGYKKDKINLPDIQTVDNDMHERTGEIGSLACAMDALQGPVYVAYGDTLFRQYFIDLIEDMDADIVIVADTQWHKRASDASDWVRDFVKCSRPYSASYLDEETVYLESVGNDISNVECHGE